MSTDGILLFTNANGQASSTNGYIGAEFEDVSLPASNNTGFSSTVTKNPLGDYFANDLAPKWQSKTLYIQDLIKIEDRTQWINGKPTYRIVWTEPFPGANGYVYGNVVLGGDNQYRYIDLNGIGDTFGVAGAIQNVMWLVDPRPNASSATATSTVDGASSTTVTLNGFNITQSGFNQQRNLYYGAIASSSNFSNDIHNYQLAANNSSSLRVLGAVVYYTIPGQGVNVFPGTAYLSGNALSPIGTSLAFPPSGLSTFLGGIAGIYISPQGTVGYTTTLVPGIGAPATGSSGTNQMTVPSGGSYPIGTAVYLSQPLGGSYFGYVTNVSSNLLTMSATLSFGVSQTLNTLFYAGPSFAISSSLSEVVLDFLPGNNLFIGQSGYPADAINTFSPYNLKWRAWGFSLAIWNGFSQSTWGASSTSLGQTLGYYFAGSSSFLQVDGLFNAMEAEFYTGMSAQLAATCIVDGIATASWSEAIKGPGLVRRVLFSGAGIGLHSVRMQFNGSSQVLLTRLRGYLPIVSNGQTNGLLATIPLGQTFLQLPQSASGTVYAGVTASSIGPISRFYSDSFIFKGTGWTAATNTTNAMAAGGIVNYSTNVGDSVTFDYYGQQFCLVGWCGTTIGLTLDGVTAGLSAGATFGTWLGSGTTTALHQVVLTVKTGTIGVNLAAVDVLNPQMEMVNRQNFTPFFPAPPNTFLAGPYNGLTAAPSFRPFATQDFVTPTRQRFLSGSGTYYLPVSPRKPLAIRVRGIGGGGGGAGSGSAGSDGGVGGQGGTTSFGVTLLLGYGGVGGARGGTAPAGGGGDAFIAAAPNLIPIATFTGGSGGSGSNSLNSTSNYLSGHGGDGYFGGGAGGVYAGSANAAATNTGGGGGGWAAQTNLSACPGCGGGAGGYFEAFILNPADSYPYSVGAGGSAGTAGTNGTAGGAGAAGIIIVEEYYQ